MLFHQKDDLPAAAQSFRKALALREQRAGSPKPDLVLSLNNLGIVLEQQNQLDEAEPLLRRALALQENYLALSEVERAIFEGWEHQRRTHQIDPSFALCPLTD